MSLTRTTVTDDDGTGTTGSLWNAAQRTADWDVVDSRWSRVTITSTGTQNNLSISEADFVVFNNATDLTINGIVAPASPSKPGKPFRFVCIGAGNVFFAHQNAGSTAANRFVNIAASGNTPFSAGTSSQAGGRGCYVYDDVNARWQLVLHEQGAWITPTSPTWTPNVTGTFVTTAITNLRYKLRGREMTVSITVTGTNSSASNTAISLNNTGWGGFTTPGSMSSSILINDSGSGNQQSGFAQVAASGSVISMAKYNSAAYTTGAGAISFFATLAFEVN